MRRSRLKSGRPQGLMALGMRPLGMRPLGMRPLGTRPLGVVRGCRVG
jgi:hypothetical protein